MSCALAASPQWRHKRTIFVGEGQDTVNDHDVARIVDRRQSLGPGLGGGGSGGWSTVAGATIGTLPSLFWAAVYFFLTGF